MVQVNISTENSNVNVNPSGGSESGAVGVSNSFVEYWEKLAEEYAQKALKSEEHAEEYAKLSKEYSDIAENAKTEALEAKNYIMENAPTVTVEQTTDGATLTATDIHGTTTAFLPKGEKGDKGEQGIQGPQGLQGVQGIKGERGPQGVKGDTGAKGETGAKGDKGDKGNGVSSVVQISKVGSVATYRMSFSDGTHYDFEVKDGDGASSFADLSGQPSDNANLKTALDAKVGFNNIAAANKPGLVAGGNWLTVNQTTGKMECGELTYAQYNSANGYTFIGKTTLENVLTGKGFVTSSYHDSTKQDTLNITLLEGAEQW